MSVCESCEPDMNDPAAVTCTGNTKVVLRGVRAEAPSAGGATTFETIEQDAYFRCMH